MVYGSKPYLNVRFRYITELNIGIYSTCRLAVIIALFILKADGISIALIFVIAVNLPQAVVFFALTFLTAVIGVPHFIELARKRESSYCLDLTVHLNNFLAIMLRVRK